MDRLTSATPSLRVSPLCRLEDQLFDRAAIDGDVDTLLGIAAIDECIQAQFDRYLGYRRLQLETQAGLLSGRPAAPRLRR